MIKSALIIFVATAAKLSSASILDETRTRSVNRTSTHLQCILADKGTAPYASFSEITIGTQFGDDGPTVSAKDAKDRPVENISLGDFSEHAEVSMRIFNLEEYDNDRRSHLVVIYRKIDDKISVTAILTANGQQNPVVSNQKMECKYLGRLAISD